jgi:hypothetical protein
VEKRRAEYLQQKSQGEDQSNSSIKIILKDSALFNSTHLQSGDNPLDFIGSPAA